MVPTEILAEQHMRSLHKLFEPFGISVGLLTGSTTGKKRKELLAALQMGLLDIVVGTHALIQEDVYFRQLGLVVTDEQHRFGVNQRSVLRRKGYNPDVLTMTATPIPVRWPSLRLAIWMFLRCQSGRRGVFQFPPIG